MKRKVLIIAGGYSKEREISLKTAISVYKELKKNKNLKLAICEPDGNFLKKIKKFRPDVVFNALHGQFGEDGYIQSILEKEKVNMHRRKQREYKKLQDTNNNINIHLLLFPILLLF